MTHEWYRAIFELTNSFHVATAEFWASRNIKPAYVPLTTGSISSPMGRGSDSTPVGVTLAGVPTYLADSMQFMLEFGCRLNPSGTYYVMPSFRGEPADSTHLCQFYHSEAEIEGDFDTIISLVESYLIHLSSSILRAHRDVIRKLAGGTDHVENLLERGFRRISFDHAAQLLEGHQGMIEDRGQLCRSLTRQGERYLMAKLGEFTWVTHFDHLSVPFYQAFDSSDAGKALAGDLLFGVGETVGAGERHATPEQVREALKMHGVAEGHYDWYVDMRSLAPLQTAGFGMGVERYLLWLTQHDDIRDIPLLLRFNGQQIDP